MAWSFAKSLKMKKRPAIFRLYYSLPNHHRLICMKVYCMRQMINLTKPFDSKELLLKISNAITSRKKLKDQYYQKLMLKNEGPTTSLDEQFMIKVQNEIQENLSNEFYSVEDLSQQMNYSRSQLYRKLKALTGHGPIELIRMQRLNHAKNLLEKKAVNVSEAAYAVGYSNISYFSKSFKKEFGSLPE